jgi:hypothetical protein
VKNDELLKQKGVATIVKLTLIGRPGQIRQEQDAVILAMGHTYKLPRVYLKVSLNPG